MSDPDLSFASEFPAASDEAWRGLVEKALGSRDFDKVMQSQTYDGITLKALYSKENANIGPAPAVRSGKWGITVPHWNPDTIVSNRAMLDDLHGGATGIALRLKAGAFPGLAIADLEAVLEGVHLDMASFTLIPGEEYEACTVAMLDLLKHRGYAPSSVKGALGIDPISTLAQTGRLKQPAEQACIQAAGIAIDISARYTGLAAFMADGGLYHMAGATEAQELGLMLSTALYYLRAMEDAGLDLDKAASQIHFSLAADADIYLTTAKFRAARLLWAQVLRSSGIDNATMHLNGVSSLRMISVKDPTVNILRSTAACFGASIGGADNICILPHDTMLGVSSDHARRIARNTQVILQEESGLSRVNDPAAGAYGFESITLDICDKAWKYFQKIENLGGILPALRTGFVQTDMQAAWAARQINIARRKDPITGVSEYPDIDEKLLKSVSSVSTNQGDICPAGDTVIPVEFHRLSEGFETLRLFSDACLEKSGRRPSIFLANLGSASDFTARSSFAKNFFEAGGIAAVIGEGSENSVSLAAQYLASGAKLAVICGSDDSYQSLGLEAAVALKAAGAHYVYAAGRPTDPSKLELAGVDAYIYTGCNLLEILAHAHTLAGENP